jgi:hypothetical protein
VTAFLAALLPSVGVLLIFWFAIRALLQADRRERTAQARIEAQSAPIAAAQERIGAAQERIGADTTPDGGPGH